MELEREDIIRLIRENFPLFIGFCIPLILLFLFLTVQSINRAIIRDPQFAAVFVADYFPYDRYKPYTVLVEHGKLVIEKNKPEPGSNVPLDYSKVPSLFFFDPSTLKTRKMNINFNNVTPTGKISDPELTMINSHPLSTERISGDGYMFSYRTGKADAMVAGLFSSSFYHQGHAIYKGSKIINIVYEGKRVVDPQFLAWVEVSAQSPESAAYTQPRGTLPHKEQEFDIHDPNPESVPWGPATPVAP
jgi:hypothetical protein